MWTVIILLALALLVLSLVYLSGRVCALPLWQGLFRSARSARLAAVGLLLLLLAALWLWLGTVNTVVCFLHALGIWLLCDALALLLRLALGHPLPYDAVGAAAIVLTLAVLLIGWRNAHEVRRTEYRLDGERTLRIVGFSDAHIGAVFSGKELSRYVARINAESPDLVVIVGDFVDDDTKREDMLDACAALSALRPRLGSYYVFGNHDGGYYSSVHRGYGREELIAALEQNGVRVLEDESAALPGNIRLIGRQDAQHRNRMSAGQLCGGCADGEYTVLLDHQPTDYDNEQAAGVSLVLSGHTHGGQFIPIRPLIKALGHNDLLYGHEKRGDTDFIVSSGIADWALKFRTGCFSEYFVVDIGGK